MKKSKIETSGIETNSKLLKRKQKQNLNLNGNFQYLTDTAVTDLFQVSVPATPSFEFILNISNAGLQVLFHEYF